MWLEPGTKKTVGGSGLRNKEKAVEVAGGRGLRVFGNWKTWWQRGFRTRILPRRVGDVSGMWNQRLVRLALLQHLRAVHGIKVKGSRGQCDRRRQETAATETGVSPGEGLWVLFCFFKAHPVPSLISRAC